MISLINKKLKLIHEYYYFRIALALTDFLTTSFLYIFLYIETKSFFYLVAFEIIQFAGLLIGFWFGTLIIEKVGYVKTFKLAFALLGVIHIAMGLSTETIINTFIFFALFRGFGRGIYWSVSNIYKLREFATNTRGIIVSNVFSIVMLLNIFIPPLIGLYLSFTGNYTILFIFGGILLFVALLSKWDYNKKPLSKFTSTEVQRILSNRYFIRFALLQFFKHGIYACFSLVLFILPFIFLKSELNVGLLASFIILFAALIGFRQRKNHYNEIFRNGMVGNIINLIGGIILISFWSIPALIIRGLISVLGETFRAPSEEKIDALIMEKILGKDIKNSALEINTLIETFMNFGRIAFLSVVLFLVVLYGETKIDIIYQIIIVGTGLGGAIYFAMIKKLARDINLQTKEINLEENIQG
jgi:MFS family permease